MVDDPRWPAAYYGAVVSILFAVGTAVGYVISSVISGDIRITLSGTLLAIPPILAAGVVATIVVLVIRFIRNNFVRSN